MPQQTKSHQDLAYLLISRGMGSSAGLNSRELSCLIASCLSRVNYYRLAAYWYQFREPRDTNPVPAKKLLPNTSWEKVWAYYQFDRHLRLLLFEAISRIEITLREKIADCLASYDRTQVNPQNKPSNFEAGFLQKRWDEQTGQYTRDSLYSDFLSKVQASYQRSCGEAAVHYREHKAVKMAKNLPIWVFIEFVTFGGLSILLTSGLNKTAKRRIAKEFGFSDWCFFVSAVALLHQVRNECAHQGRVWNRQWVRTNGRHKVLQPILKKHDPSVWLHWSGAESDATWEQTDSPCLTRSGKHTAAAIVVCYLMLKNIAPENSWKQRLFSLFDDSPLDRIAWEVGFCHLNWQDHPIWNEC